MRYKKQLFALYIVYFFVLCRFLDLALLFGSGLDPGSLNVKKLKELLNNRGVSYAGAVEKQDMVELVQASGALTKEEVEGILIPQPSVKSTRFAQGSQFYKEVMNTKDSAWLIQVTMDHEDTPILSHEVWTEVIVEASKFGIKTGNFKCSSDKKLCTREGWTSAMVLLVMPKEHNVKGVVVRGYMLPSKSGAVIQWLQKHLSTQVKVIKTSSDLTKWTTYSDYSRETELRMILFSTLKTCPMFLSALAIKFNGLVEFAMVDTSSCSSCKKLANFQDLPVYMVVTPESTILYGKRKGESFSYQSMELFLRTLMPEMNDVFLWSLIIVNAYASFELFLMYSDLWVHFLLYLSCAVKYNLILFMTWLMILWLNDFFFMRIFKYLSLKCLRLVSGSALGSVFFSDYNSHSGTFLLGNFIVFASVAGFLWVELMGNEEEEAPFLTNWWHNIYQSSYFQTRTSHYFASVAAEEEENRNSQNQNAQSQDVLNQTEQSEDQQDPEVEARRQLEQLAALMNLLRPVVPLDYLDDLPVWKYKDRKYDEKHGCLSDSVAPQIMEKPRKCTICLENYCYSHILCGLPCGHNFHRDCIMPWLKQGDHICPLCRWPSNKPKP